MRIRNYFNYISILVLSIFLISCEKELYDEHINHESVIKEISLDKFLRETGIKDFKKQIKVKSNTGLQAARNPDGSYELSDFVIDTEIIKRFVYDEKITYTFRILPVEEEIDNKYFNIIYYFDNGWQTKILEYTPTEENLILLKSNLTERFEGTLTQVFQSVILNPIEEGCVTWILPTFHCTLTGKCTPTDCDRCSQCIGTTSVEFCNDDPVTVTYISAGPSTGGGPTSGTGSGSGASDGSSGSQTTNNEDEIATSPVFESAALDNPEETDCEKIMKFLSQTNGQLKLDIDWLKTKVNERKEFGVGIRKNMNPDDSITYTTEIIESQNGTDNTVDMPITGNYIGNVHNHPIHGYAIPSFADMKWLLECYDAKLTNFRKKEIFTMVVCKDKNGTINVYCLFINDIDKLRTEINDVWDNPIYLSFTDDKLKMDKILEDDGKYYKERHNELEKLFLQKYGSFGINLYKSTDVNLTQWNKLDLDSNPDTSSQNQLIVTPTPCQN